MGSTCFFAAFPPFLLGAMLGKMLAISFEYIFEILKSYILKRLVHLGFDLKNSS